ncbi:forkhead box protein M1 isoform X2 [Dermochelys coriacea]|uniref:forkhead box protein M1 isoform X2 n=2 Tax=Dermochelys coriacea TaxID=27794 RepID=UPI001CA9852B|nr:forkhead box protein M1 isoform X2 [Dermochelys coriacea]
MWPPGRSLPTPPRPASNQWALLAQQPPGTDYAQYTAQRLSRARRGSVLVVFNGERLYRPTMRTSPRRPLILKRRKLSLPDGNASNSPARDEPDGESKGAPKQEHSRGDKPRDRVECVTQKFPAGIKIINHPTMLNTQVVIIPPDADIQSIIEALTAKGKECGSNGPNKFILISSGGSSCPTGSAATQQKLQSKDETSTATKGTRAADCQGGEKNIEQNPDKTVKRAVLWPPQVNSMGGQEQEGNSSGEATSSALDNSLTNIQWLGKMSSDGLGPCTVKQEMEKENQTPVQERIKTEEDSIAATATATSSSLWQDSISERPPYSYMAMIQFAINSTEKKRMTLKDIYTWIEDHFPYFKYVAKPGWKNSIRHNLSLHDMFVRETSANGKISFWTIHPDANRYLTLDQVFKPLDAGSPTSPEYSESQKRYIPELQKNTGGNSSNKTEPQNARRKMKPLLPRVSSYLVPIQFPVSQPLILQSSLKVPQPMAQGASLSGSESIRSSKRVRIAPKVLPSTEEPSSFLPTSPMKEKSHCDERPSAFAPTQSVKENNSQPGEAPASFPADLCIKEEKEDCCPDKWLPSFPPVLSIKEEPVQSDEEPGLLLPVPCVKREKHFTVLKSPPRGVSDTVIIKRRKTGRSRRKQHLVLPCSEEPVLVLPESSGSDSFRLTLDLPFLQETQSLELSCSQEEGGPFKTPVKEMFCKLPVSSTPSKVPTATPPMGAPDSWRLAPIAKESSELDFSPVRTPQVPFTSLQENLDLLGFNSTPLKNSLFDSPQQLLQTESNDMVSGPLTSSPDSNPESTKQSSLELPASGLPENQSLMEGLVLDTMNNSLSKILLDISFSGLEDDILGQEMSWSQFIPELR